MPKEVRVVWGGIRLAVGAIIVIGPGSRIRRLMQTCEILGPNATVGRFAEGGVEKEGIIERQPKLRSQASGKPQLEIEKDARISHRNRPSRRTDRSCNRE